MGRVPDQVIRLQGAQREQEQALYAAHTLREHAHDTPLSKTAKLAVAQAERWGKRLAREYAAAMEQWRADEEAGC